LKKKLIGVLLTMTFCICAAWATVETSRAAANINITLPSFKVTMNGEVVNNDYSRYPLIVYKDITYFPMTYSDCRFLGIESTWTGNSTGLFIESTGVTTAYNPYISNQRNGRTYQATIPDFPISVNGKAIDNSKEEYPVISFRDITYFPMTWKYCVGQFAWDYKFDSAGGLVIKSTNAKLDKISIPKNRLIEEYGDYAGKRGLAVIAKNGYCYYVDDKGAVMQAPLSDMKKTKKVYQLGAWSYGDGKQLDRHSFYEENGKAMLYYHSGGAVMGSDHRYILKKDGTTQKIQGSYWETTLIGNKLYMYWRGPTPGPGNLHVSDSVEIDDTVDIESKRLGPADYWYYSLCDIQGLPIFEMIGNELYVRAAKVMQGYDDGRERILADPAVFKVNTDTNTLTRVSQSKDAVINAQIAGEYLYYIAADGEEDKYSYNIYKHSLKESTETLMGSFEGDYPYYIQFAVVGEHIYYIDYGIDEPLLYRLADKESLNPKAEALSINITGDNREYLACTFKETQSSRYRIMVFDKSGKLVFKTSDSGSNVVIEGRTLYFYNITTETLCKAEL